MFRTVVLPMFCPSSVNFPRRATSDVVEKLFTLLDLCVSSLRKGHANLLCIVPILTDDPRRESKHLGQRCAKGALGKYVLSSIISHPLSLYLSLSFHNAPARAHKESATNPQRTNKESARTHNAAIAQLAARRSHNPQVVSLIPTGRIRRRTHLPVSLLLALSLSRPFALTAKC